jgi:hypothetical protein
MPETSEHQSPSEGSRAVGIIEASLNYITESGEKPVYYAYEPPAGVPRQTGQFAPQSVPVEMRVRSSTSCPSISRASSL